MSIPSNSVDEKPINEKDEPSAVAVSAKEVDTAAELVYGSEQKILDPAEALRIRSVERWVLSIDTES